MSIDNSLKSGSGLAKHRNVLTRAERVAKLNAKGSFNMESDNPLHLPKVGNVRIVAGAKKK